MNIYFQEIKNYLRVTTIWAVTLSVMTFAFMSMFGSFSDDVENMKSILASYPPQVLTALNLQVGIFFTVIGFFAYLLTFIWLTGAMQAMNLGMGILSKEVAGKTADFLLTKPITRFRMLTQKLAAVFTLIVFTNIIFITTAVVSANIFSKTGFDHWRMIYAAASLFCVQVVFASVGFFLATVVPKIKTVLSYTLPIVFGLFILSLFGNVIGKEEVYYLTPFKYFDVSYMLRNGYYQANYLWVASGVVVASLVVGFLIFINKDVEAAS